MWHKTKKEYKQGIQGQNGTTTKCAVTKKKKMKAIKEYNCHDQIGNSLIFFDFLLISVGSSCQREKKDEGSIA